MFDGVLTSLDNRCMWIFYIITSLVGFVALSWSATRLVEGAAALARLFGLSPLLVGLTIIGFGTSLPEIFVSFKAAYAGDPGLAIGTVLGSNIANICLVFGIAILVKPLVIESTILKREFPFLIITMLLISLLLLDHDIDRQDGIIILGAFLSFVGWLFWQAKHSPLRDPLVLEFSKEIPTDLPIWQAVVSVLLGIIILPVSAHFVVTSVLELGKIFSISETTLGLTVVALGTSLPELATAIVAARKNEPDLVLGNVLGSNIFNLLAVLPFPAFIAPSVISHDLLLRDMGYMFAVTVLMFIFISSNKVLSRWKGFVFLASYGVYLGLLAYTQ